MSLPFSQASSASQVSAEPAKPVSNEAPTSNSSSLRWLASCVSLFDAQDKDAKDVSCMSEVLTDRVLRADVVLSDLERILNQQVREFVARQAHLCTTLLTNDAEVLKAVRDADTLNDMLARQLDSSQAMSRGLFQHITGIIETPTLARGATAAKTAPAP